MNELSNDILHKAAQGDIAAFEQVYKTYSQFVYNVAYRMAGKIEEAEEITQEVFITIHQKLEKFRFESSFKTWIYRITVNSSINYFKKMRKNKTVPYEDQYEYEQPDHPVYSDMDKEANQSLIQKFLDYLNPDQRACIVLRNIEGLSYEEMARSLNININTVRTRLKRAREKLLSIKDEVMQNEL
ncbi:MAG: RNA polymerase sigma factor [Candidatus Omnitrophica bacterium]|nr:RNA polymerase sigma factor [Candidatus Omnitrophota bacterium]